MANNKRFTSSDKYNKHFTLEDRCTLQKLIHDNPKMKLKIMAEMMEKDPTTLSKEIKRNRIKKTIEPSTMNLNNTICLNFKDCSINNLCKHCFKKSLCKQCIRCITCCPKFKEKICQRHLKFPWVCNGCENPKGCRLNKYYYYADKSNQKYLFDLHETRKGININQAQLAEIDNLISPLIKDKNQTIDHIYATHEDVIPFSKRTLYNYIENQYLSVKNIDLPRKVAYKPRKKVLIPTSMKNKAKIGRTYEDYQLYLKNNPGTPIVQMDTVEGVKTDSNRILTIHFPSIHFMLGFMLPNKEAISVSTTFDDIQRLIGIDNFKLMLPLLLTDNGVEFYKPENIEVDQENGEVRTKVFYCHPMCSFEKAEIENNHRYIRYIIPKGHSIQSLNQDDLDILFSHINSTMRVSTGKSSPYELACMMFGEDVINKLRIKKINPNNIFLKPQLLRNK